MDNSMKDYIDMLNIDLGKSFILLSDPPKEIQELFDRFNNKNNDVDTQTTL